MDTTNENAKFAEAVKTIGGTTYTVKSFYSDGATETLEQKLLRILRRNAEKVYSVAQ